MKGLITKDMMILRNQWKTLAMIFFIGIVISITQQPEAIIAYLPILSGMLVLGTFSYDEMDNSYSYLLTLPTSRKTYVKEKYLFSFTILVLTMIVSIIACIFIMMLSSEPWAIDWIEIIITAGTIFTFVVLLLAIEIPLRLKFGIEKGRIALYVMFGILAIGAVLISKFFPEDKLSNIGAILEMRGFAILISVVIASLIILYISFVLSTKILAKKEF